MAYRFTNTDKWLDTWFSDLKPLSKLVFMYLCDQCDLAGILVINIKTIAFEIGTDKQTIEKALKEIESRVLYSKDRKCIFIRNFLKHQRNYPFNEKNSAHISIIRKLESYKECFGFQDINDFFFRGVTPPPTPPTGGYSIGKGNSIGMDSDRDIGGMGEKEKEKTWRDDFDIYKRQVTEAYNQLINDEEFIREREKYHPNLDIHLTMEKAFKDFWGVEAGWKNKKSSRSKEIDWKATFRNAISQRINQVYKQNDNGTGYNQNRGRTTTAGQTAADKAASRESLENLADAILGQHQT